MQLPVVRVVHIQADGAGPAVRSREPKEPNKSIQQTRPKMAMIKKRNISAHPNQASGYAKRFTQFQPPSPEVVAMLNEPKPQTLSHLLTGSSNHGDYAFGLNKPPKDTNKEPM